MIIDEQKHRLRRAMRQKLAEFAAAARPASGATLITKLNALPAWRDPRRVLLFAPTLAEPDLDALWDDDCLAGKECAYPAVSGVEMEIYKVDSLSVLQPVPPWNLREPVVSPDTRTTFEEIDLVLVPGLAFDDSGGRLGRGGGFYDRLLAKRRNGRPLAIGVGFQFQRLDCVPLAPHDALLDAVLFC